MEYDEISQRQEKTDLAERTMANMKQAGGRFLTKKNGYWELATDQIARERVSSTFRTVRNRLKLSNQESASALADSRKDRKRSIENDNDNPT